MSLPSNIGVRIKKVLVDGQVLWKAEVASELYQEYRNRKKWAVAVTANRAIVKALNALEAEFKL